MKITTLLSINQIGFLSQFGGGGFQPPTDAYVQEASTNPAGIVVQFISNLLGFITVLAALFFIVWFFMGAFSWVTGGDDSGKVEKARTKMFHSVLGLIVIVISYSLIGIIGALVGIDLINLEETIHLVAPSGSRQSESSDEWRYGGPGPEEY